MEIPKECPVPPDCNYLMENVFRTAELTSETRSTLVDKVVRIERQIKLCTSVNNEQCPMTRLLLSLVDTEMGEI